MDEDDDDEEQIIPNIRTRAFSECRGGGGGGRRRGTSSWALSRPHLAYSDSNLSHIDKEKTFSLQNATVQPGELLAKVVCALGGFRGGLDENDGLERMRQASVYSTSTMGIHGFTDSQILASEQNYNSDWSITASERSYAPQANRMRASSMDIKIPIDEVKVSVVWVLVW